MILLTLLFNYKNTVKKDAELNNCEPDIPKYSAFIEYKSQRKHLMRCYCFSEYQKGVNMKDINFKAYGSDSLYCQEWLDNLNIDKITIYLSTIIITMINAVGQQLLIHAAKNEKHVNSALESKSMFILVFIQQYFC